MIFGSKRPAFAITLPRAALDAVFDECDRYDADETGGRLIGTYREKDGRYEIDVAGIIEPGPSARRSPTSFFQDGEYQEQIFRSVERAHPEIEHLGNWHTHHVNGYPTLSGGDKDTYFRTVNHKNHNIDLFYALLVVRKNPRRNPRYDTKHFVFRRGDETVYEIPHGNVQIVDAEILWPRPESNVPAAGSGTSPACGPANAERAKDQEFFAEFYQGLRPLLAKGSGTPYWKGALELVDGTETTIVALEASDGVRASYSITAASSNADVAAVAAAYKERQFRSARHAVLAFEKDANRAIHTAARGTR
jgi:hypothetical protein